MALLEIDNVRTAWRWAAEQDKAAEIRTFCVPLGWICEVQGWYGEMNVLFGQAADLLRERGSTRERGTALALSLVWQSRGCSVMGHREKAVRLIQESRSILSRLGARQELALCYLVAVMVGAVESPSEAEELLSESLAIYTEMDVGWGMTFTLSMLSGAAICRGGYEDAERYAWKGLQIGRKLRSTRSMQWSLLNLGDVAYERGKYVAARQFYQESLALSREIGYQINTGGRLVDLGRTAYAMGAYEEAREYYQQALAEWKKMGNPPATVESLEGLGDVAAVVGDRVSAREYYRQAIQLAVDQRFDSACLDALVGLAQLLAEEGEIERPVELAVLALHHPARVTETLEKAQELLDTLRGQHPSDGVAIAQERGRERDLWATVEELLTELEEQWVLWTTASRIAG